MKIAIKGLSRCDGFGILAKCHVIEIKGNKYLQSYNTIVAMQDQKGKFHRLWDGWSNTTGKHLSAFGISSKKIWNSMPVETLK